MLNSISHQGNANLHHVDLLFYILQDGYNNNIKKTIGEDMEKLEPSFIAGGNVKW